MVNNNWWSIVSLAIIVVLMWVLVLAWNYYILDIKSEEIKDEIKEEILYHSSLEFGWKDNYELAQEAFLSDSFIQQNREQLEAFVDQSWWEIDLDDQQEQAPTEPQEQQADTDDQFERWEITEDQIDSILQRGHIMWEEWSRITLIEYSDVNCPFCARHSNDGTIQNVLNQFDSSEINHIFRTFPIFGDRSYPGSYAIECAGELWWSEVFYDYKYDFFALNDVENRQSWEDIASEHWLDLDSFSSCIDNAEVEGIVSENMWEWQIFWVQWTPWNVLLDTETWEWVLVPWAYPASEFWPIVEDMLN